MEITLDYAATKAFAEDKGMQALLEALDRKASILAGHALELYSLSLDWLRIGPQFILKAKGARGDVIVSWA